ncbi:hypothetical protein GALMADRAFT_143576 [Galerina marginata CBS 339.88]|uniref:CBM1 domain-containing protein n=1 Tax=Galerina marginata (strain CBS 339.88) TaxID=685588 RepID=A0A067SLG9_GALM3|nr:hypothetical protein GALMADRAFT_143576 [Galerina marginata CBS 339.88]
MASFKFAYLLALCSAAIVVAAPADFANMARQVTLGSGTTTIPATTTAPGTASTPSSTPVGTVPHWGQCTSENGNWIGGACIAPYTCVVLNPFWSQCL